MTDEEQDLWGLLSSINEWIRFADAKAGAIIALAGAIGSLTTLEVSRSSHGALDYGVAVAALAGTAGAILCAILTLLPRVKPEEGLDTTVYFGHIARFTSSHALLEAARTTRASGDLAIELAHQVRENARIAEYKFGWIRRASLFVASQLTMGVILLAIRLASAL